MEAEHLAGRLNLFEDLKAPRWVGIGQWPGWCCRSLGWCWKTLVDGWRSSGLGCNALMDSTLKKEVCKWGRQRQWWCPSSLQISQSAGTMTTVLWSCNRRWQGEEGWGSQWDSSSSSLSPDVLPMKFEPYNHLISPFSYLYLPPFPQNQCLDRLCRNYLWPGNTGGLGWPSQVGATTIPGLILLHREFLFFLWRGNLAMQSNIKDIIRSRWHFRYLSRHFWHQVV